MMRNAVVALTLAGIIAAGCSDDDSGSSTSTSVTDTSTTSVEATSESSSTSEPVGATTTDPADTTATTQTTTPPAPDLESVSISTAEVAVASVPLVMRPHPDGTDWLAERAGIVRSIDVATGEIGEPILDLTSETTTNGERGLLGMDFDPAGERLYVHFSGLDGEGRIESFAFDPDGIDPGSRAVHLTVDQPFANHNGGDIHFGLDGHLYVAFGDGGSGGDPENNGVDTNTLLGAVLRLAVDGTDGYDIPADNPFADGGGAAEIYLYGVRNPWRIDIDEATGDLWIADVGQNEIEEIDHLDADVEFGLGAHLGWNLREGTREFAGDAPEGHIEPIYEYDHDQGCSVAGGFVYRGDAIGALQGAYVFSDLCEGEIRAVDATGAQRSLGVNVGSGEVLSFGEDHAGELYVLTASGPILAILPG